VAEGKIWVSGMFFVCQRKAGAVRESTRKEKDAHWTACIIGMGRIGDDGVET
jgi:hypothetical protein